MSNPYFNDVGNFGSGMNANPSNGPMKHPPPPQFPSSMTGGSSIPPAPHAQLPHGHTPPPTSYQYNNTQHHPSTNAWPTNQGSMANMPPATSGYNMNGLVGLTPSSGARNSTPPSGPPHSQNMNLSNHVPSSQYSSQNMPPPPISQSTMNQRAGFNPNYSHGGYPSMGSNVPTSAHAPMSNTAPYSPNKVHNTMPPPLMGQNINTPLPPTSDNFPKQPPNPTQFHHMQQRPPPSMMQNQLPPPTSEQIPRQMHHPGQHHQPHQPQLLPPVPGAGMPPSVPGPGQYPFSSASGITHGMSNMGIDDKHRPINIMMERRLLPLKKHQQKPLQFEAGPGDRGLIPPKQKNCNTDVFRCTLNAIPSTQALLNKVKLPLGLIIHPFKDLSSLPVISAGTIVRCKRCRTYINPFVNFLDERRWRCNLCFVVNEVPEEFLHHPVTKTYGEPHTRPECTNATLEFIAPQEYMVRPPQPAVYMFLFDVSHSAVETGYLQVVCDALLDHLDHLPGDSRTKIGFLSYNGTVHFYRLAEGSSQPQMLVVSDLDDIFLPTPDSLLVNLREGKELVSDLLRQLPELHEPPDNLSRGEVETQSALGSALQAAQKMMAAFGGRITVFQQSMPTTGPGALKPRENPNSRAGDTATDCLNPSTDFYKKLALDSSAHQVAIDFFFMNSQYIDIATLSCTSRFSAGDLHYYPGLHATHNPVQIERLSRDLDRYLTRKIGFEAVMRIRCTKGIAIHTFHGNFFVRSTDLLALANINPDAGFGLNLSIEESLTDLSSVCVQAALLYTSSKGERRIRVHTMCFPVAKHMGEIFNNVDSDAVVSLLSKMAVDRSITSKISDARDALINAVIDASKAYKETISPGSVDNSLLVPPCMKTFPLMISCLMKHPAFRSGVSTRLDDRVFSMIDLKMQPTCFALQSIHPDLYRVDDLSDEDGLDIDERIVPQPQILPLSAESINRDGVYLLDAGWHMYLHVGPTANREFLQNVLGVKQFSDIEQPMYSLPDLDNPMSETFHNFLEWLQDQRPHYAPMQVVRADSREHYYFMLHMRQDKTESSMSLQEFLQHVQQHLVKK
uniref:protein transport protein Sec24A-like isoform X1 n=2 Tax=Styela clava TaxID=7725 RepID=UPI00193AA6C6|nr:protein transport protein Sec24A-like isoform X1 [Styela clava]